MDYDHKKIEAKWQKIWEDQKAFEVTEERSKKKHKKYVLVMFPYPSADGLHVGHVESYAAADIYSRFLRMNGQHVLQPMGWDAFGLPAENFAIKKGVPPWQTTGKAIVNFRRQIKSLGLSYDWSREVSTADPNYYRWTQWLFLLFYKNGLAYRAKAPVNWCPSCQTVLANEQVVDGACERCHSEVIQKELEQWFFRITKYAEKLLKDLEKIDWPEKIKAAQRNWIGRKVGINIYYEVEGLTEKLSVFTTRPDTNFGATFIVVAPDSEFVRKNLEKFPEKKKVEAYVKEASKKTELERMAEGKKKTGVFTGLNAINNLNGKKMPIYVGDFVLATVGTGNVVAVPGHDLRDFEFAQAMGLEVIRVVVAADGDVLPITRAEQVQEEEGTMINSGFLNGLDIHKAKEKIMDYLERKGWGKRVINYRVRDWLVSRQRYWGAPIPMVICEKCGYQPVSENALPVLLPQDIDFKPTGESPLAYSESFHQDVKCPKCGGAAKRESDTMDTFVCSSWYYLRYCDPQNFKLFALSSKLKYWCPVDLYLGGAEHAVGHLLYVRFVAKALNDLGHLDFKEPFLKLRNQGMILAEDGRKMSKSWGNVINPDDVVKDYGADTLRMYEMFMGDFEETKPWSTKSIIGIKRFLERVWELQNKICVEKQIPNSQFPMKIQNPKSIDKLLHKTIKKVTEDIEAFKFNTAIAALMILVNEMSKQDCLLPTTYYLLLQLLYPFAPHITEELWEKVRNISPHVKGELEGVKKADPSQPPLVKEFPLLPEEGLGVVGEGVLGVKSLSTQPWPKWDQKLIKDEEYDLIIQINGKMREAIKVVTGTDDEGIKQIALESDKIKKWIEGKEIKKIIVVKGRLINIVVNG